MLLSFIKKKKLKRQMIFDGTQVEVEIRSRCGQGLVTATHRCLVINVHAYACL